MAEPRTINLPGSGLATQDYTLAPGLIQYVQSVRVAVDNTAGADATPILSVSEQSGVVIADVPQSGVIPAGEADGAATWALRLTDKGRSGSTTTQAFGVYEDVSRSVPSGGDVQFDFGFSFGDALLDLSSPTDAKIIAAGFYEFTATIYSLEIPNQPGKITVALMGINNLFAVDGAFTSACVPMDTSPYGIRASLTLPFQAAAGNSINVKVNHNDGAGLHFSCALSVLKVA